MTIQEILLPNVGDLKDSEIIEILVKVDDVIQIGDSLITIESDKASMEVPAETEGVITEVLVQAGNKINVGEKLFKIEVNEGSTDLPIKKNLADSENLSVKPKLETKSLLTELPKLILNQQTMGSTYHASPMIRQMANRLGVDLSKVIGSGKNNRITTENVEQWIKQQLLKNDKSGSGIPTPPLISFSSFGEIEEKNLSRIKRMSGKHLSTSWLNVPHVTQFDEIDIDKLEKFRQSENKLNKFRKELLDHSAKGVKLTPLSIYIKIIAQLLQDFPLFNSSLSINNDNLILKKYINIGVAVDTEQGLVVPVIKNVDKKDIIEIAFELSELSKKARESKLKAEDMQGGCFTISSLGGIGGSFFTPIVNVPEVAILGIGRSAIKPHWNGKVFEPKLMLPIAVSYDHRVIDGAEGARFIKRLGYFLNDIEQLISND